MDQEVDVVVNAANRTLLGGLGVDGAIHKSGGPEILEECKTIRKNQWPDGLPVGKAVITTGGRLKAKYVIHTVGPIWSDGLLNEGDLLAEAYRNCLLLANEKMLQSIAFPAISTGAYGYPAVPATRIAFKTVREFAKKKLLPDKIVFVLFDDHMFKIYNEIAKETS